MQRLFVFVAHSLIFTDLEQQGAGNQGKEILKQFSRSRGQLRPLVTTGDRWGYGYTSLQGTKYPLCILA